MNYVVRVLDGNGKLRKERIMFYAVRILNHDGSLKKVIKSKILSQRHWREFPKNLKAKGKGKNMFNTFVKTKNKYALTSLKGH